MTHIVRALLARSWNGFSGQPRGIIVTVEPAAYLVTVAQIAEIFGWTPTKVQSMDDAGELPPSWAPGRWPHTTLEKVPLCDGITFTDSGPHKACAAR